MNSGPALPPGWTSAIDPSSGRVYYANPHTGESSWEPPVLPPPPPPPPRAGIPPQSAISTVYHQQQAPHQFHQQPQHFHQQQQQLPRQAHMQTNQEAYQQTSGTPTMTGGPTSMPSGPSAAVLAASGLLVPAARAIVDAKTSTLGAASADGSSSKDFELNALTVGQMADLCTMQQEQLAAKEDTTFEPYHPLNPYGLPTTAKRQTMEAGRLDIRIHSLYDKLRKIPQ